MCIRLVLFDALGTLFRPHISIGAQYVRICSLNVYFRTHNLTNFGKDQTFGSDDY
jgi:hypothetical protein